MPPLLPVRAPPCPGCGASLITDGANGSCPRCGRRFALEVADPMRGIAYRSAPLVEVVPLRDGPPPRLGLRIESKNGGLDVSVGSVFLYNRVVKASVWLALLAGLVPVQAMTCAGVDDSSLFPLATGLVVLAAVAGVAANRGTFERVTLAAEGLQLIIRRFSGKREVHFRVVELDRIAGVREIGRQVRLDLDDGETVEIGAGLNLPRGVVRWLVRGIGQRLPKPPEDARPGPVETGAANDDSWAARQLCSDEACTGLVGPDGRCTVCARAVEPQS